MAQSRGDHPWPGALRDDTARGRPITSAGGSLARADIQTAGLPPTGALAQKQRARVAFVVGPFEGGYGTSLALKQGMSLLGNQSGDWRLIPLVFR